MKLRFTFANIIKLSLFLLPALFLSCNGKASPTEGPAGTPVSAAAHEIVIVNAGPSAIIQKETQGVRRLTLVRAGELSASEQLSRLLVVLAADLKVKAIVVSPAIRGTADAFAAIREKRPDLLLYAIGPEEDSLEIEESATYVVSPDQEADAYSAVWAAARLGCKRFVYVALHAPVPDSDASHRRDVLVEASKEFKLDFTEAYLNASAKQAKNAAPAPDAVLVFEEARLLVLGMREPGNKTAFYLADDSVIAPMVSDILQEGCIVVGMFPVSFLMQHPETVGVQGSSPGTSIASVAASVTDRGAASVAASVADPAGEPAAVLANLEKAIGLQGGSGRLVLPGYPEMEAMETAVILSLQQMLRKKSGKPDSVQFAAFLKQATPNISWRVDYSMDRQTGVRSRNHLLVFQDLYLIGRGYLPFTKGTIPESYRR